jgi:RNA polymerase sigma factor (TIGR02999 family)
MTGDVTELLRAWTAGDPHALDKLAPLVYEDLRRMARHYLRPGSEHTLQPTALAHEAYLRLMRARGLRCHDQAHFFAVAAQMMRRILVDAARARAAVKRQAVAGRVPFSEELPALGIRDANVVALDDALDALGTLDPRKARVVELRYFVGLSVQETADVLHVSPETVQRDWRLAKAWLVRHARRGAPDAQ